MIIGICGKKGHGKDAIGKVLVDELRFKREYFAKPLKDALKVLLNMSDDQVHGHLREVLDVRYNITPRQALQTLGTEWGRNYIHQDIWAMTCIERMRSLSESNWVVTDLRFLNEERLLREGGSHIIKVIRPESKKGSFTEHQSEIEIDNIKADITIVNDGTLDQLNATVIQAYAYLREGWKVHLTMHTSRKDIIYETRNIESIEGHIS